MSRPVDDLMTTAQRVADRWITLPGVQAVALGGSLGRVALGTPDMVLDAPGDIDLYIYAETIRNPDRRLVAIGASGAREIELDRQFWETEDVWVDAETGVQVEAMQRSTAWIQADLDRVLNRHVASIGYTTSIVDSVRDSIVLADPTGWYGRLRDTARYPYPPALRDRIIAKNHPILRSVHNGYRTQIASAIRRDDLNSVAHRTTALLASFWDILFAINLAFHPGEKRLVAFAEVRCPNRPDGLGEKIRGIVQSLGRPEDGLLSQLDGLLNDLDECVSSASDPGYAG